MVAAVAGCCSVQLGDARRYVADPGRAAEHARLSLGERSFEKETGENPKYGLHVGPVIDPATRLVSCPERVDVGGEQRHRRYRLVIGVSSPVADGAARRCSPCASVSRSEMPPIPRPAGLLQGLARRCHRLVHARRPGQKRCTPSSVRASRSAGMARRLRSRRSGRTGAAVEGHERPHPARISLGPVAGRSRSGPPGTPVVVGAVQGRARSMLQRMTVGDHLGGEHHAVPCSQPSSRPAARPVAPYRRRVSLGVPWNSRRRRIERLAVVGRRSSMSPGSPGNSDRPSR